MASPKAPAKPSSSSRRRGSGGGGGRAAQPSSAPAKPARRAAPGGAGAGRGGPQPVPPARLLAADLTGILLITAGLLMAVGLRSPSAGPIVAWLSNFFALLAGRLVWGMPALLIYLGARTIWHRERLHPNRAAMPGLAVLFVTWCAWLAIRVPAGAEMTQGLDGAGFLHPPEQFGGIIGAALVWALRGIVGVVGCPIVLTMLTAAGLLLLSERTMRELLQAAGRRSRRGARRAQAAVAAGARAGREARRRRTLAPADHPPFPQIADLTFPDDPPAKRRRGRTPAATPDGLPPAELLAPDEAAPTAAAPAILPGAEPLIAPAAPAAPEPEPAPAASTEPQYVDPGPLRADPVPALPPLEMDGWKQLVLPGMPEASESEPEAFPVPETSLIEPPPAAPLPDRTPEIEANSRRLEATMGSFGVEARVVNTEVGPTITRYEMELAPGIRVSKVAGLADDIALALASAGIRIEAPVPGKGVIGIEVPNQIREIVHLHPLLTSPEFLKAKGGLPFVIGKDIAGGIKVGDLAKMPHMLVAGTTNSGKSVCLNCLIISMIYRFSPRDLRFLMVDPKRVELTLYDGIPHLDRPVVVDPEEAADLLRGAVTEMYARYDRLSELGVRNIISYNQKVPEDERMPYLVIVIDELAELMMTGRAEVEPSIVRLAQLARAVGIHLVLATQRPAVNVVTGQIKANIPTRLAFRVPQLVDSRVILDDKGAERLIGRGDMLFASEETGGKPERLQGAFVGEAQVHRLVDWLQKLPKSLIVRYADSIIQPVALDDGSAEGAGGADDAEVDELFWQCVQFVRGEDEASTSRLQRTFGIGYNRAGRIMDQMHAMGIVGPPRGSRPREVLAGGPLGPGERRAATAPETDAEPDPPSDE